MPLAGDSTESAAAHLRNSTLFRTLSRADLENLHPPPELISLRAGEVLMRQGETGSDYFHLIRGQLRVLINGPGGESPVAHINPGEGVGEMSLITGDPRSATVIARLDCKAVRVCQQTFLKIIERNPAAAIEIARIVIHRLGGKAKPAGFTRIAVLPLQADIETRRIAGELAVHLDRWSPSRVIGDEVEARSLPEDRPGITYEIYAAGTGFDEWTRHCVARADLILIAVRAGTLPDADALNCALSLGEIDKRVLGRTDLLLIHGQTWSRAPQTAAWLERLSPKEHHHVRAGSDTDMARLARIIAGKAVNLVLGGGGARAFSAVGVLRAFREAGLPVDRAGGSSIGAFVAALCAYDGDFDSLVEKVKDSFRRRRPTWDFTLPVHSILRGNRLQKVATDVCGDWRIEDLPLTYFCLSADLSEAEVVVHTEGPVWAALRASAAMPVIGPPLLREGRILIDGGALNNLPIDIMRERFSGLVFAVNNSTDRAMRMHPRWELTCPSGFEILCNRLSPFGQRAEIPGIVEILYRTLILSTQSHLREIREKADWLIEPPVDGYGLFDFRSLDKLAVIGYRHTAELLEKMRADSELTASRGLGGIL